MYYYDEFGKEFEDELSFHEYLEEIDERAKWVRVPSRSLSVLTVSGHEVLMRSKGHCILVYENRSQRNWKSIVRKRSRKNPWQNLQIMRGGIIRIGNL